MANKSILLPFQETNFITIFISWLNLDLGINTCNFPGMDTYTKTSLQLAFPAYVIFLVALIIIISSYSSRFSNIFGKKNPVATLATLVDMLETFFLLNILFFATFTWYSLGDPDSKQKIEAAAYVSATCTIIILLTVVLHHVYTYTPLSKTKSAQVIESWFTRADAKPKSKYQNPAPEDDSHRFSELLDDVIDYPINTNDYEAALRQKPAEPTRSVDGGAQYIPCPDTRC